MEKIEFLAGLKHTGKPIKIGIDGDTEIIFECPATELAPIMKLTTMMGIMFKVTIEREDG